MISSRVGSTRQHNQEGSAKRGSGDHRPGHRGAGAVIGAAFASAMLCVGEAHRQAGVGQVKIAVGPSAGGQFARLCELATPPRTQWNRKTQRPSETFYRSFFVSLRERRRTVGSRPPTCVRSSGPSSEAFATRRLSVGRLNRPRPER